MKKTILFLFLAATAVSWSQSKEMNINAAESSIQWLAKKVTGQHNGIINFVSGNLTLGENNISGGSFEVAMNTINVLDLSGEYKEKLEGHLKSNDFFGVEKFPSAQLNITGSKMKADNVYAVEATLTIKEISHPITFDLQMEGDTATAKVVIDRSKYNVRYGSTSFFDNLGDKAIYDDFELEINLKF